MRDDDAFDKPSDKPRVLKDLSIADLKSAISDLNAQIRDIEALIEAKEASKSAADSFFKSGAS
jgi:uncharacterized small protein (DUF1192 family)